MDWIRDLGRVDSIGEIFQAKATPIIGTYEIGLGWYRSAVGDTKSAVSFLRVESDDGRNDVEDKISHAMFFSITPRRRVTTRSIMRRCPIRRVC